MALAYWLLAALAAAAPSAWLARSTTTTIPTPERTTTRIQFRLTASSEIRFSASEPAAITVREAIALRVQLHSLISEPSSCVVVGVPMNNTGMYVLDTDRKNESLMVYVIRLSYSVAKLAAPRKWAGSPTLTECVKCSSFYCCVSSHNESSGGPFLFNTPFIPSLPSFHQPTPSKSNSYFYPRGRQRTDNPLNLNYTCLRAWHRVESKTATRKKQADFIQKRESDMERVYPGEVGPDGQIRDLPNRVRRTMERILYRFVARAQRD
ncbi:hypothetical protein EVAR_97911_1 [Eumeta japonica]|uniref:Uncharacterized protein n=1 Tax=Eumeta variegata TaxID=151549 RepID=A0A4C2A592_EUMVA|nr:hypothetical protein EVAR_97911_1 [Eumeta japonica]